MFIFALTLSVRMALFCAAIRRDLVFLERFSFLINVQVFSCEISLVCRLKCPNNCFSSHLCFLVIVVLLILVLYVFDRCNQSFFPLFYVVFESSYRCIDSILNAGQSSSSILFLIHTVYLYHLPDAKL